MERAPRKKVRAPKGKRQCPRMSVEGQWQALSGFRQLPRGRPKPGYDGPTRASLCKNWGVSSCWLSKAEDRLKEWGTLDHGNIAPPAKIQ